MFVIVTKEQPDMRSTLNDSEKALHFYKTLKFFKINYE
jgi:hypothetical protein